MRVPVFGCEVEAELAGVLDDLISQLHIDSRSFLVGLLQQDGVEGWIQFLSNVLEQHWLSELDGVLEGSEEVGVGKLYSVQLAAALHLLDPLVRLPLRVDAEGPPARLENDNSVFEGEVIRGESIDVPLPHLHWVPKYIY